MSHLLSIYLMHYASQGCSRLYNIIMQIKNTRHGWGYLYSMGLALCLAAHAAPWTERSMRAVSFLTQAVPAATEQDGRPAVASSSSVCGADGENTGPFDDSVPDRIPELRGRVTDLTGHLSADCVASISDDIRSLEDEKGAQVRVLLVGSTGDESIEDYANRVFHAWKLGRKGVDDGVLLVAALHDHHDRIEVGYGLEGRIPDAVAGDILRSDVRPQFAAGNYGAGVSAAVDDLAHLIRGEALPKPSPKGNWMRWQLFVAAVLLVGVAGAVAIQAQLNWYWLMTLPFLTLVAVDAAGLVGHWLSGWTDMLGVLPFALVAYFAGMFFASYPKSGLLWLGCTAGTFVAAALAIHKFAEAPQAGQATFWNLEAGGGSLVIGTIIFMMVSRNPLIGRHFYSGGSPSGGSSGTGSGSSSSGSDSSSGGGGDSGGGGASDSW